MRTYPECYHCVLQVLQPVMGLQELDLEVQLEVTRKALVAIGQAPEDTTPPGLAGIAFRILRETAGDLDLYRDSKTRSIAIALGFLDDLRSLISGADDPLLQGLVVAAAGNMIDVVHASEFHVWEEVQAAVEGGFQGLAPDPFRELLSRAPYLLYLADNAGEAVFDRALIETLDVPVIYAVKGGPILNDATRADALAAGIDQVAEIVETGSQSPGTNLAECSGDFLQLFDRSPLILAKGQANFETLDRAGEKIFFLLRAKCPLLAREIGVSHNSLVFARGSSI